MSTLHLVEPSCGVKREEKTLPQAVQSINTEPGLQSKHTLIIAGQGPTRTSEYMFTITAKSGKQVLCTYQGSAVRCCFSALRVLKTSFVGKLTATG